MQTGPKKLMTMDAHSLHLDHPARYRICAQGLFEACWLDMLSGVWLIYCHQPDGKDVTVLVGQVADQAALVGVLEQLYSLGFPLLLVEHLPAQEKGGGDNLPTKFFVPTDG